MGQRGGDELLLHNFRYSVYISFTNYRFAVVFCLLSVPTIATGQKLDESMETTSTTWTTFFLGGFHINSTYIVLIEAIWESSIRSQRINQKFVELIPISFIYTQHTQMCVTHTHTHTNTQPGTAWNMIMHAYMYVNLYALATNKARTIDFAFWTFSFLFVFVSWFFFRFFFLYYGHGKVRVEIVVYCCLIHFRHSKKIKIKSYKHETLFGLCMHVHASACLCAST